MSQNSPTKAQRREANRIAAAELKAREAAQEARAKKMLTLIIAGVVGVLVLATAIALLANHLAQAPFRTDPNVPLADVANAPAGATADGGLLLTPSGIGGQPDDAVPTVGLFYDYQCGACQVFEMINEDAIRQMVADGSANVVLYPVAFLGQPSQRAAEAMAWIADRSPEHAFDFHVAVMTAAMNLGADGLTSDMLNGMAEAIGVPADVREGLTNRDAERTFGQWVVSATQSWISNPDHIVIDAEGTPQLGTPTVMINGTINTSDFRTPGNLQLAVADVAAGGTGQIEAPPTEADAGTE